MEGLKSDEKRRRLLLGNLCRDMGEMGDILGTKQGEKLIVNNNNNNNNNNNEKKSLLVIFDEI